MVKKTFGEAPSVRKKGRHLQFKRYAHLWLDLLVVLYVTHCMYVSSMVFIFSCVCKVCTSYLSVPGVCDKLVSEINCQS